MKKLVVTRADEGLEWLTSITHPVLRAYAARCGADFRVLSETITGGDSLARVHYRLLGAYPMLNEWDVVLSLDSDVIVRGDCPNIFEMVPQDVVSSVFEDKGTRQAIRLERIQNIQLELGDVGWRKGYPNSGFMVIPRACREVLSPEGRLWNGLGYDDVLIGYRHVKNCGYMNELSFKFNHMSMFSEPWNNSADPLDSYVIHYAGNGRFPRSGWEAAPDLRQHEVGLIKKHMLIWKERGLL